jgi:hypothetical protein
LFDLSARGQHATFSARTLPAAIRSWVIVSAMSP